MSQETDPQRSSPLSDASQVATDGRLVVEAMLTEYREVAQEKRMLQQAGLSILSLTVVASATALGFIVTREDGEPADLLWILPPSQLLIVIAYATTSCWVQKLTVQLAIVEYRLDRILGQENVMNWHRRWTRASSIQSATPPSVFDGWTAKYSLLAGGVLAVVLLIELIGAVLAIWSSWNPWGIFFYALGVFFLMGVAAWGGIFLSKSILKEFRSDLELLDRASDS